MRTRRRHALLLITAVTAVTVVPVAPAVATEVAAPATVTATLDELPVDGTVERPPLDAVPDHVPSVAEAAPQAAAPDSADDGPVSAASTGIPGPADTAVQLPLDELTAAAPVETDVAFSTLGIRLPAGVDTVQVRTRDLDGAWGAWVELDRVSAELDGPDPGTPEAADAVTDLTEPAWVGPSDAFQLAVPTDTLPTAPGSSTPGDHIAAAFGAELIDTLGLNEGVVARTVRHLTPRPVIAPAEAAAARPAIISRARWGADERLRTWSTSYRTPTFAVLHHTAGSNDYTKAQSPAVVRGIYSYHARTLGWGDIGYNLLVDRYGQIYEGRYGGVERGAIGAHARGFNTGSFGVSVMGNHDVVDITGSALDAVARVIAWKYDVHGIDPAVGRTVTVGGRRIPTLTGHRDVGSTACPGRYLYGRMGQLRQRVAALASGPGADVGAAVSSRFRDVPVGHPHVAAVEDVAERGVTRGCSSDRFCPDASVTRGQMASFLVRALDLPAVDRRPFRDAHSGPHAPSIAALAGARITAGCTADRFCPGAPVTRAQMASFLARAFEVPSSRERFPDVGRRSAHAGAIGGLVEAGIVHGYRDGTFRPGAPVSRAEMAAFLSRALARDDRST